MSHQDQLEKSKYRHWVRGGLAYKYLKEGIEGFADDVVQKEHTRIIGVVNNTSGNACDQCELKTLKPLHTNVADPITGTKMCPSGQFRCNCLTPKKKLCPNKVCDVIMEEILKSHGSTPPAPNWKNTDIHKWYTCPWEIANCFIYAPGYSGKTSAAEIDISGLLHLFINNTNLHEHLSCKMTGTNIFMKCREGRNKLFHSSVMELEEAELTECIDDIIAILEDPKELASRADAKQAVLKLKQLKQEGFVITTHNEIESCRAALDYITKKSGEFKEDIHNAKDDIDLKKAETIKAIDDKAKQAVDSALEEIDKHNESLNQRLGQLEQRFSCLESRFKHFEEMRQNIQERFDYVKIKQVFQKKLVSFYKEKYVNTSISPLKLQENDINISEVYINSEMFVKEVPKENTDTKPKPNPQQLHTYGEILNTNGQRNKSVYIEGDVGAGKSTFCKMMIQNWCSAVSSDENKDEVPQDVVQQKRDQLPTTKDRNIEEMKKIDFLFFLPLKRMGGFNKVTEMIKAVVKAADLTEADLIDTLFEKDSDRCLIVADGLDELTLPENQSVLQHVGYGLPERGKTKSATMVTFSRPSAKGILNLASSECDLRVKLMGINKEHIEDFAEKYQSKFKNTKTSMDTFMSMITRFKLEHLENSPLLLQQLVWLYFNGFEIGKSRCDVYCHIVNIMFRWSENKEEDETDSIEPLNLKQMQLPKPLRKFESFNEKKEYVCALGQVAFESVMTENCSSYFSRSRLKNIGFSKAAIDRLTKLGIIVEENCYNPTQESTQLSFIHMSYLEFFAAVFASCQFDEQQSDKNTSPLKELFSKCKTATDILQLLNLLKMICGLCPFLITQISHFISEIVKRDDSINREEADYFRVPISIDQIQQLMLSCLSECDTDDRPMIYLSDVYINECFTEMSKIRSIIPDNVINLNVFVYRDTEVFKWITQLKNLQYLHIKLCRLPHAQMTLLSSFIEETSLSCLSLTYVGCEQCYFREHLIDLSKHKCLQKLTILNCQSISISDINTEHLQKIQLDSTDNQFDICLLQNARRLTELHIGHPMNKLTFVLHKVIYNSQTDSVIHTLHQLQTLRISNADIDENSLTVTPMMGNLKHIILENVNMSLGTWRTFVDSLLTLQQAVYVDTSHCTLFGGCQDMSEKSQYLKEQEILFEITAEKNSKTLSTVYLRFWTKNNKL